MSRSFEQSLLDQNMSIEQPRVTQMLLEFNKKHNQQQQSGSNNHYDAGNPRAARRSKTMQQSSTVYATAVDDQHTTGNVANCDVAVHQGGGPTRIAE